MSDHQATRQQLLEELANLRQRVAALETASQEKETEAALRENEERYRLLVESIPQAIWRAEANGETTEFNNRWYEYTGQTYEEARGFGWMKAMHPDDVERVVERLREAGAGGELYQADYRLRRASDGCYRWHLAWGKPMKDREGNILYWFGTVTDIDDQKQVEEELRRSRATLQATIDCLPFDFFAIGPDGCYIIQNAASKKHWGVVIGRRPEEVCTNQRDLALWLDNNQRAFAGEKVENEVELTLNGERRFCSNVLAPIRDRECAYGILGLNIDITDRKRAEAALRESEERYRTLAESTRDIIYILDRQGRLLYANQAALACVGLSPSDIVGKQQTDLFPPEMARIHLQRIAHVFETGEVYAEDERFQFGPNEVWLRIHLVPLRNNGGPITSVMGVCHNITDRKRAEEALKNARDELEHRVEERTSELVAANEQLAIFRRFAEASAQGFGIADLNGCITYVNPALCRMMGENQPEDVVARQFFDYVAKESWPLTQADYISTLVREGRWLMEGALLTRQGAVTPIISDGFLLRDEQGEPAYLAAIITDISERKAAEEALRQSEEKCRGLLQASPDAVVMTDLSGIILFASRQTWELAGLSDSDELVGRSVFDYVIEDDRRRLAENILLLTESGVRKNTEYTALHRDGTTVPTEISSALSRDAQGRPVAVMAVIRDISTRKHAHEQLQKEHRTLKYLLQSSDHERQLIAYEIHDGLAQQLAGTIMQLQTYFHLKDSNPKEAAKAYDAAMTMLRQGHFEARRLIAGVRPPILDEQGVVEGIAHLVHEQSRQKGPKIDYHSRVDFDRLAPTLENSIYRIAQEGLANACQHSKSEKVRVGLVQRKDRLQIKIRDWGIGFDPKNVKEGCYGLVGIRQRARLLGGKCSIQSMLGKGARIVVELPVVERE
jgi:PAS domain S-box-containing protein